MMIQFDDQGNIIDPGTSPTPDGNPTPEATPAAEETPYILPRLPEYDLPDGGVGMDFPPEYAPESRAVIGDDGRARVECARTGGDK
jgi:hypothetical protein